MEGNYLEDRGEDWDNIKIAWTGFNCLMMFPNTIVITLGH
jgi:hypothetical protein